MRSMSYHLRRVSVRRYAARTRMVILNSPNNPSGAAYSARDLAALAEVLVRHPDVVVLTDEIYEHLVYDGFETASIAAVDPRLAPRTITCNGMAKGYGMTGWRIGFAGGPRELIRAIADLQSQNVNAPSTIGQHAAVAALDGPQAYLAERAAGVPGAAGSRGHAPRRGPRARLPPPRGRVLPVPELRRRHREVHPGRSPHRHRFRLRHRPARRRGGGDGARGGVRTLAPLPHCWGPAVHRPMCCATARPRSFAPGPRGCWWIAAPASASD